MQGSLNQYLIRLSVFILLILIVIVFLYPFLQTAFLSNIYINLIIILALVFGLIFNVYNLSRLNSDYSSLANFNIHKSPQVFLDSSSLLKGLSQQIHEGDGRYTFKSSKIEKILESVDMSLLSLRETSRYLVGLLVFLGLLGTFWGLLKTIGSVGNVISGLGIDDTNVAGFFNSLKDGLNAPLQGMSVAFSSSLLGLAGSLILGFADLNLGQAQNKFTQFLEKILQNNSSPDLINTSSSDPSTLSAIQKIYDNLDNLVYTLKETSQHQSQIFSYMQSLTEQMKELNVNSREQDKKLSNFLSTQLNSQSNMLQLTSQLSQEGLIDKQTKKYFENIDKGIQQLLSNSKKK
jgi:biopolymer transport protein ExbB/TolQ